MAEKKAMARVNATAIPVIKSTASFLTAECRIFVGSFSSKLESLARTVFALGAFTFGVNFEQQFSFVRSILLGFGRRFGLGDDCGGSGRGRV
jgi:hypothetical protein